MRTFYQGVDRFVGFRFCRALACFLLSFLFRHELQDLIPLRPGWMSKAHLVVEGDEVRNRRRTTLAVHGWLGATLE